MWRKTPQSLVRNSQIVDLFHRRRSRKALLWSVVDLCLLPLISSLSMKVSVAHSVRVVKKMRSRLCAAKALFSSIKEQYPSA